MKTRELHLFFLFLDLVFISLSIFIMYFLLEGFTGSETPVGKLVLILNGNWILTYLLTINDFKYLKADLNTMLKILMEKIIIYVALVSVTSLIFYDEDFSRLIFFSSNGIFFLLKIILSFWLFYKFSLKNKQNLRPIIIIGDNSIGNQLYDYFVNQPSLGFKPVGILDDNFKTTKSSKVIGKIENLEEIKDDYGLQDVIITIPLSEKEKIRELIEISERNGAFPHIVANYFGVVERKFQVEMVGKIPLLNIRKIPLDKYTNRFWKRAFDIVAGSILLFLLSPVFIIIAIAIKIESKGPVFYKPTRLGVHGEPFIVFKFRSMRETNDANRHLRSTVLNDPRITKLGKFLRKSNLDELPQLLNVLNNEMSIIGPRPHRVHLNKTLQKKMRSYMVRHYVKPGITGWAQVNGWRGPTETKLQYTARTLHDLWYIENWNFGLDIYILFLTIFGKKTRKNAF